METITLAYSELQKIIRSAQLAFLESGKHTLTRTEADKQFGSTIINDLLNNKLLTDTRFLKVARVKSRFLVSDIITAIETFKNMKG